MRRWLELSAYITCFHLTNFHNKRTSLRKLESHRMVLYTCYADEDIYPSLSNGLSSVTINSTCSLNTNRENQFGTYGECYYCCLLRKDEIKERFEMPFQKRFEIIGDYAPCIYYLELFRQEKNANEPGLILDDEFFLNFHGLEIIDVSNIPIERFELTNKNINCLKYLIYLALENNDLSIINMDFEHLNNLAYIKLVDNPFESLPINCLSSKSLQNVDLSKLGRLIELDSNTKISSKLKILSITDSTLISLPPNLGTDARSNLTKLTLNGVPWWGVNGLSVNEVIKFDSFKKKFIPFLNDQELADIYQMYDEDVNGVLTFSEINLMNAHMYRFISRLRPSSTTKIVRRKKLFL